MHLTPQAQAVLLLTVSFAKADHSDGKPLSNNEWARFAVWMKDHGLEPAALLKGDLDSRLAGWMDRTVTAARLHSLLGRGAALGFSLEKWQRAGVWALTRSDPQYPERLKRRLRAEAPAVLFGCGDKALLSRGGIAVVGSRNASDEDLAYAGRLGKEAAAEGYSIISGGARGIDQSAMFGALEAEGTAVGVLADGLLKATTSPQYCKRIMRGDLTLVSPFNPDAGFNVGNAMSRNRYIYCLSDAAIVVSSTADKGGTWSGALEDLKAGWVPLWVKPSSGGQSGNPKLTSLGAHRLPMDLPPLSTLLNGSSPISSQSARADLRLFEPDSSWLGDPESEHGVDGTPLRSPTSPSKAAHPVAPAIEDSSVNVDFYALFLARMLDITSEAPMTADDVAARLQLQKSQVGAWLKRAVSEGAIAKLTKPVRYQMVAARRRQISLFGEDR